MNRFTLLLASATFAAGCSPSTVGAQNTGDANAPFTTTVMGQFNEPWAMAFLPDGSALITEKRGVLKLRQANGALLEVSGIPKVAYKGQGGLGDVIIHPDFAKNGLIYLSFVEAGQGGFGAAVARAKLDTSTDKPVLNDMKVIWRQYPKVSDHGHFGHRLAFGPDDMLYISSGERQKFDPAQDMAQNLGKIIRLTDEGQIPDDNPNKAASSVTAQIWSLGHRNPLGIAFDKDGRLWEIEMGPKGGDEVNLIKSSANYGWPKASNGSHYDGRNIPDHVAGDGFEAPKVWWNPSISPGSLMIYSGDLFPQWKGDAFIGALGAESLIRVHLDGDAATKGDEWPMGARIREVKQGPNGVIWVLEDGDKGRLLKLTPGK
jgi:aldose sugar dehydrogenase